MPAAPERDGLASVAAVGAVAAVFALAISIVAIVLVTSGDDAGAGVAGGGDSAATTAHVELSEFAIEPDAITVAENGTIHVENVGSTEHNLAVVDGDMTTPNLASGESAELSVEGLGVGDYEVICQIPGHADSGMRGTLSIVEAGAAGGEGDGSHGATSATSPDDSSTSSGDMDYQAMTDAMLETMAAFPADTEGVGNQLLDPTEVLADGTKVYDLTMELGDWEVEPGRVVEAWTFNGTVPAPMMRLDVGDEVQVRVQNDLPIATDIHWHGVNVDNNNDGVAPITQPLIEPGDSYVYDFVADEQAVAMYHPHAHGHMLLPNGMFGAILVGRVRLPLGQTVGLESIPADLQVSQEIPMVLNDSGVIGYSLNGKSFPATQPYTASVGDWVLIHYYNEGTQIHPMHLHQFDQIVVAKDGYPLDSPYTVDTLNVAPGERYSVLVNLDRAGAWVWHCHILPHVERESGMFGMVTAIIVE
jgi:FtsP/CotA-like multicopper oxidase with cupredoxin domain